MSLLHPVATKWDESPFHFPFPRWQWGPGRSWSSFFPQGAGLNTPNQKQRGNARQCLTFPTKVSRELVGELKFHLIHVQGGSISKCSTFVGWCRQGWTGSWEYTLTWFLSYTSIGRIFIKIRNKTHNIYNKKSPVIPRTKKIKTWMRKDNQQTAKQR